MRKIERISQFRRDYRRERKGQHARILDANLDQAIRLLVQDSPLPPRYKDHPLAGPWVGHRDCHLRLDLILIYRKLNPDILQLVRLGSHSELF